MKKFLKFLNEMAEIRGKRDFNSQSRESEFKEYLQKDLLKLINKIVNSKKDKLFKVGNVFFLSDKEDNYLGFVQLKTFNLRGKEYFKINESSSKMKGGFYQTMFPAILAFLKSPFFSDSDLSKNAASSYKKLNDYDNYLSLTIIDGTTFEEKEFSEEELKIKQNFIKINSYKDFSESFNSFHTLFETESTIERIDENEENSFRKLGYKLIDSLD